MSSSYHSKTESIVQGPWREVSLLSCTLHGPSSLCNHFNSFLDDPCFAVVLLKHEYICMQIYSYSFSQIKDSIVLYIPFIFHLQRILESTFLRYMEIFRRAFLKHMHAALESELGDLPVCWPPMSVRYSFGVTRWCSHCLLLCIPPLVRRLCEHRNRGSQGLRAAAPGTGTAFRNIYSLNIAEGCLSIKPRDKIHTS